MKRTVKVPDQCQMEKKKGQGEIGVSDGEGVDLVQHESTLGEITEEVASQGFDLTRWLQDAEVAFILSCCCSPSSSKILSSQLKPEASGFGTLTC